MANKPIKEYEDFSGAAGYLIVDSLTNETSGGKMKVPNYVGVTDGYVLTKTSNDNTDEVVWAQAGGSGITNAGSPLIIPAGYNDKIELQYDSDTLELNGSNELTVKDPIPDTTSANDGDVLTYSSDGIVWAAPSGGGGGVSPIVTTEITPVLENNKYTITLPNNNAYYAVSDLQGNAEIRLPTIGATENYNIVLFINSVVGEDKQITVYGDNYGGETYGVHPMNTTSQNGWMYGMGLVQFVFLGRGYTMSGMPTEWS